MVMLKKIASAITSAAMVAMFIPAVAMPSNALAEKSAGYLDSDGVYKSHVIDKTLDTSFAYGDSNSEIWVLAQGAVERGRLVINGNVNLLLEDGCKLTVNGGICVKAGYKLSIYAQSRGAEAGVLESRGGGNGNPGSAGIGANGGNDGGSIAIHGGNITAKGSDNSAGIGGQGAWSCQDIVITGGSVTAIGGNQTPGIGAGWNGAAGDIVISGGYVSATGGTSIFGGKQGAGIGAGPESSSSCGDISITNGAVVQANSISNKSRESEWNGVVFEGNEGKVYGGSVAPAESFEISSGKTLTINKGESLTIKRGITLSNKGTITNSGAIRVMQGGKLDIDEGALNGENIHAVILDVGDDVDLADTPQRTYGAGVDMPTDATKTAHTLDGWYEKDSNNRVTTASAATSADKTYFPKWIINQYTISFDTAGGSEVSPITQDYGTAVTLPANPTRAGYEFAGWSESVPATMPAKDIKLTAKWTANTNTSYKVEHYQQNARLDGYVLAYTESLAGTTDTKATANAKPHAGFTCKANSGTIASGNIDGDGSLVLRLYYDRNVYGVTLDAKGGKVDKGAVNSYTYGIGATLPTDVTRAGYNFDGWFDNEAFEGKPIKAIGADATGAKIYYAKWTAIHYHSAVAVPAKAATCTEAGLTEGSKCSSCGAVLKAQESVPALGHEWGAWRLTKPATLKKAGTEARSCQNADCTQTQTRELARLDSKTIKVKGVSYLCDGKTAVVVGASKKLKKAAIPATVKADGVKHPVTGIAASAFKGCKRLKSITVTSKKLTKESVKGSLKGSSVEKVVVKVGGAKANKSYAKKYKKLFTAKVCGKKGVKVVAWKKAAR